MFLPDGVYNRIPQIWILMGVMFIACGLYLGFEYKMIYAYLGMGAVSFLRGIWIYNARSEIQKQRHLDNLRELREARDVAAAEEKSAASVREASPDSEPLVAPSESELVAAPSESAATAPEAAPEPAANDSVLVAEPRAREPGEPIQYDPYDSLATRQHK